MSWLLAYSMDELDGWNVATFESREDAEKYLASFARTPDTWYICWVWGAG